MDGYGLALGGGGARGSYEIGVWKALRELDIPISFVTGTSVGALNGVLIIQDDFEIAVEIWNALSVDKVIKTERRSNNNSISYMHTVAKAITNGGLDVEPLRMLLIKYLDEEKIKKSKIGFGLVTVSLKDFKPVDLYKEDIPEGKLIEYLLASACLPIFKTQVIDDIPFLDGAFSDNIPISLLVRKNIKNIIAVDMSTLGLVRKFKREGINLINIKNSLPIGGILKFDSESAKENIELGYYDTLRKFGKIKGSKYYVSYDSHPITAEDKYLSSLSVEDFKNMYIFLGLEWSEKPVPLNTIIAYNIMNTITKFSDSKISTENILPTMVEITAEQLGIKKRKLYSIKELIALILQEHERIIKDVDYNKYVSDLTDTLLLKNNTRIDKEFIKKVKNLKFLVFFNPDFESQNKKIRNFRRLVAMVFPKVSISNILIALLLSRKEG